MTWITVAAVILAELAVLFGAAAAALGAYAIKLRRRLASLQAIEHGDGREGAGAYVAKLQAAIQGAIVAHRSRFGSGAEVLHTGKLLRAPQAPDQVALQLRYDYLRHEQKLVEEAGALPNYWSRRAQTASEVLRCLGEAEEGLRQWWAAAQRRHGEEVEKLRHEQGEAQKTLNFKLQRRDISLDQAKQNIEELEAYRARFNMLHGEVLREREANEVLRRRLREQAGALVEEPLQDYQESRAALDGFLDRGDIAPFAVRNDATPSPALRTARQRRVLQGSERRLTSRQQTLNRALTRQRGLIEELKQRIGQAEEREERIKAYYQQKIRQLQRVAEVSRRSADVMEKEINRSRRTSGQILERMEQQEQAGSAAAALERTIDRFAAQAIEMQQRIQELEQQVHRSDEENLTLQARLEAAMARGGAGSEPDGEAGA